MSHCPSAHSVAPRLRLSEARLPPNHPPEPPGIPVCLLFAPPPPRLSFSRPPTGGPPCFRAPHSAVQPEDPPPREAPHRRPARGAPLSAALPETPALSAPPHLPIHAHRSPAQRQSSRRISPTACPPLTSFGISRYVPAQGKRGRVDWPVCMTTRYL